MKMYFIILNFLQVLWTEKNRCDNGVFECIAHLFSIALSVIDRRSVMR